MKTLSLVAGLAAMHLLLAPALAGVYKYQDENGKWHFTDKPPKNQGSAAVVTSTAKQAVKADLKEALYNAFNPTTDVDRATLAVVKVNVGGGSGSGFFVTDDGYIVTNRHVVRPSTSTQWQETKDEIAERQQELDDFKASLDHEKQRLKDMKANIDEHRDYYQGENVPDSERAKYKRYVARYKRDKERYDEELRRYRKHNREFKSAKSNFGFASSVTNFSRKFTITLKDGKEFSARLVKISKDYDLALLKLDKYKTPFLPLAKNAYPRQGAKVFAIGSPLGISDSLTTGIVTKAGGDFLLTDTRILPGNSGGPLIDPQGKVLGVNTAIVAQNENAAGLGLAIYSRHVRSEFARELGGKI